MKLHSSGKGITLLEILISMAIMSALAALAIPLYMSYLDKARTAACLSERDGVNKAIARHAIDNPGVSLTSLSELAEQGYLAAPPRCPYGGEYVLVMAEDEEGLAKVACSIHYWPATAASSPAAGSEALVGDDFENDDSDDWLVKGAYWKEIDGKYFGGNPKGDGGENRTFRGEESWTDYTIEIDAALLGGGPSAYGYGIYFRAHGFDGLNAYVFQYDPGWQGGSFLFRKVVNGYEQYPFAVETAPPGYNWEGEGKHLRIVVSGDTFKVYIDDVNEGKTPVVEARDSSYAQGAIGFRTWMRSYASFDNLVVRKNI